MECVWQKHWGMKILAASLCIYIKTWLCVVWPSSGAQNIVFFTRTNFQLFIAKKLLGQFNQNHVLDALQSHYFTYQI